MHPPIVLGSFLPCSGIKRRADRPNLDLSPGARRTPAGTVYRPIFGIFGALVSCKSLSVYIVTHQRSRWASSSINAVGRTMGPSQIETPVLIAAAAWERDGRCRRAIADHHSTGKPEPARSSRLTQEHPRFAPGTTASPRLPLPCFGASRARWPGSRFDQHELIAATNGWSWTKSRLQRWLGSASTGAGARAPTARLRPFLRLTVSQPAVDPPGINS